MRGETATATGAASRGTGHNRNILCGHVNSEWKWGGGRKRRENVRIQKRNTGDTNQTIGANKSTSLQRQECRYGRVEQLDLSHLAETPNRHRIRTRPHGSLSVVAVQLLLSCFCQSERRGHVNCMIVCCTLLCPEAFHLSHHTNGFMLGLRTICLNLTKDHRHSAPEREGLNNQTNNKKVFFI